MATVVGRDEKAVKRITCRDCASIIEYVECEVKTSTHRDYGGGSETYRELPCPQCGVDITISRS